MCAHLIFKRENLILINKIIFNLLQLVSLKFLIFKYYKYAFYTFIPSTIGLITLCTHEFVIDTLDRVSGEYHDMTYGECFDVWCERLKTTTTFTKLVWNDSLIKMKWTKEKKIMKRARWWLMTMLMIWWVSNNKNGKYLTSALAICWEEHSLPFHYQPTTPCRRM